MKKVNAFLLALIVTGFLGTAGTTLAETYKFITAEDLNARLGNGSPMILVDIRPADQFAKGYIKGSIETNAIPVETEKEKARLTNLLPMIQASTEDIIILCPKGDKGAKKAHAVYKANGVDVNRMLILEKGMNKWPYPTETKKDGVAQLSKQ